MMEILRREDYQEYEEFVSNHPRGEFTQSIFWQHVKNNWQFEAVVSRGEDGKIMGACGVLIQRLPILGTSLMYSPRGPVCDPKDLIVLRELKAGIDALAKVYNAYAFKMDPDIPADDTFFIKIMEEMGFRRFYGPDGFETIQARFNYRLPLAGRTQEDIFMSFHQKTRYNIRLAQKKGVEVRPVGKEYLDDFMRIYETTGKRDGFNIRPKRYLERMLDALGVHARLYMGFYREQPVCGAITVNYAGKTSYVYGASDNAHRNVMPNYLMQWEMICWALETGCRIYDFQGVAGNTQDKTGHMYGLYRFKRGFGGHVDELAGEFDYTYRPVTKILVGIGILAHGLLQKLRRMIGR